MTASRTIALIAMAAGLLAVLATLDARAGRGDDGGAAGGVLDPIRGGLMYDKWWTVLALPAPETDHPLYPPEGARSGSTTWRCKECHGWDYKGADGAYGPGSSHYSGLPGVFGSTLTAQEMFDLIKLDGDVVENGHGYGAVGVPDEAIDDLVEFLQSHVIDTDDYIDADDWFVGDVNQGEINFNASGSHSCLNCHGPDGTYLNFGSPEDPEYVGTIARANPWEFLHKVRFGHPNTPMPSWLQEGGSNQGAADIGIYSQTYLPTEVCDSDTNHDGVVDVDDLVKLLSEWGQCP